MPFFLRLLRWVGAVLAGLAVITVLGLWRLSMGPVDLDFARGWASRSFDTAHGPVHLQAGRVSLVWTGWQEPLRLVLSDIAATDRDGVRVANVPAVVINLSLRALAGGALQPTEIDIDAIRLEITITREGLIEAVVPPDDAASASPLLPVLMEQLLGEPDPRHPLGRLSVVRIHSARIRIDDQTTGFVWDAPAARAVMSRDQAGVRIEGALSVQTAGHTAELELHALYGRSREQLDITLQGRNLRPSAFAAAALQFAPLAEFDLPMEGEIRLSASGRGAIRHVALELKGGAGRLGVPGVLGVRTVDSVALRISFTPAESLVRVEFFTVGLHGALASLAGILELKERAFRFEGQASLAGVPVARLAEFWPEALSPGARVWALANISDGRIEKASLDFAVSGDFDQTEQLKVERSVVAMHYQGLTVRYLEPMPPVRGVAGTMSFDGVLMRYEIAGGAAERLRLAGARIDILGLEKPTGHRAEIEVKIGASIADALAFLAHPRLGVPPGVLFNPKRVAGDAAIALRLVVPLVRNVAMADVEYSATAELSGFSLQNVVAGLSLADAGARLEVDARELRLAGRGRLEGQPLDFQWREQFGARVDFRRRYEVRGVLPEALLARAGIAVAPFLAGDVALAPLVYQAPAAGPATLSIRADLKAARIALPQLAWQKEAGGDGLLTISARLGGNTVPAEFELRSGELAAAGRLELGAEDGRLIRASLSRLALGRTNVNAELRRTEQGFALELRGAALDVARLLEQDKQTPRPDPAAAAAPLQGPVLAITLDIAQLLLKRGTVAQVRGSILRQGDRMVAADLTFGSDGASRLALKRQGSARTLLLVSPNAGRLLSDAGWLDGLVDGELEITAEIDDARADPPVKARIELRRFRITAMALEAGRDVGTLNGLVEQIRKAGNAGQMFDRLEARIDKQGGTLIVRQARTSGASVGMTAQGTYDLDREQICLAGSVTPAYVLNAMLSNIPILGWVLTGGEGRGLFAINYALRGPIDAPRGTIEPASAITPGFLRRMLEQRCGIVSEPGAPDGKRYRSLEERQQERIGH